MNTQRIFHAPIGLRYINCSSFFAQHVSKHWTFLCIAM